MRVGSAHFRSRMCTSRQRLGASRTLRRLQQRRTLGIRKSAWVCVGPLTTDHCCSRSSRSCFSSWYVLPSMARWVHRRRRVGSCGCGLGSSREKSSVARRWVGVVSCDDGGTRPLIRSLELLRHGSSDTLVVSLETSASTFGLAHSFGNALPALRAVRRALS